MPDSLANATREQAAEFIKNATPEQLAALDVRYPRSRGRTGYSKIKRDARERSFVRSREGRNLDQFEPVANPRRRKRAKTSLEYFARVYFPDVFTLKWSPDHLTVIEKIERAVLKGGLFAMALPRGSGKTTLCETASIWSILYGHREFVALIGPSEQAAAEIMSSIRLEFEINELLFADFPEVCGPVRALEGITNRSAGQLYEGKRTRILWTANQIVLPTIPGSAASGAIVKTTGITGRIRGMKFKRPDGSSVRPSLIICDDPSNDMSARSPSQNAQRESILSGAVLGLAGPGKKIAGVVPCTVIQPGDLADRILNRDLHPEFNGQRSKMVYKWPTAAALWEKYAEIRADSFRQGNDGKEATTFYRKNRREMDKGAKVGWPQRKNNDELSALQHAYNLRLRDETTFFAEYQNDPIAEQLDADDLPTALELTQKINGYKRRQIPLECQTAVAFIDVQKFALYYASVAFSPNFTGYVFDYGTYPEQPTRYFRNTTAKKTIRRAAPGAGLEGAIFAGLEKLVDSLVKRKLKRDDGADVNYDRIMIDGNWGLSTETVYSFCRQSKHAGLLIPGHGRGVGASSLPFSEYRKKRGDLVGHNWRVPAIKGQRMVRHILYDTNYWKSFVFSRFGTATGDGGSLSFYKESVNHHRLISDQLTSEYRVRVQGRGRSVDEWKHKPERFDNHYLDCLVGCCVAASAQGCELSPLASGEPEAAHRTTRVKTKRGRVSYL